MQRCFQSKCSNISAEGLHFSAFHYYSAHGHELSECVRADKYNLIYIFLNINFCIVLLCSLHGPGPGPGPGPVLCMIRERHVILKAALHSGLYSCLAAASYIIMLYCLVYRVF